MNKTELKVQDAKVQKAKAIVARIELLGNAKAEIQDVNYKDCGCEITELKEQLEEI